MSKRPSIYITGICGFIGTNIALEANERGYNVFGIDNLSRQGVENNRELLKTMGVRVSANDVLLLTDENIFPVDCIVHLAANVGIRRSLEDPIYDFQENAVSTIFMLEWAKRMDSAFIYASTNKVYSSDINNIPVKEEETRYTWDIKGIDESFHTDGRHHTPYGVSKLTGDMYCQEYFESFGVKTVVNRMSCIYGEYQKGAEDQGWVDHFVRSNMFGDGKVTVFGDGKQVRDVLWGRDVAKLYLDEFERIDKCAGQVFNVGGGEENTLSVKECLKEIETVTGTDFDIEYKDWRNADQKIYISDTSKVRKLLGWKPSVNPKEGIKKMVERYRNELN